MFNLKSKTILVAGGRGQSGPAIMPVDCASGR